MPFGTGRPSGRSWELKRNKVLIYALCLLTVSFAGCGYSPTESNKNNGSNKVGSLDPRDLATPPTAADGITVEMPANAIRTPGEAAIASDAFTQAGQFEPRPGGMLGSLGMNLDTYFAEDIQDPIDRIKRLERALTAIQGDLKTVAPPIQRLVSVETDIQELVTQLQILLENDSQPSSPLPAATSVPKPDTASQASPQVTQLANAAGAAEEVPEQPRPEKQATPPPTPPPDTSPVVANQTAPPVPVPVPEATPPPPAPEPKAAPPTTTDAGTPSVVDLRIGEHADKTRLVLDLNANASFAADLDNNEHILVIELPDAGWSAAQQQTFDKSPLLKGYTVESGGKGSMLILQLRKASGILAQQKLEGETGKGQRIVIDLKK